MGTQQALTTEQLELLVFIDEIQGYEKEHPNSIPAGGIKEVLDSSSIMDSDNFSRIANVLEYYGYIHNGDELTIDGKQYIDLFKEYLEQKAQDATIQHISFSLINFEKLELSLADSLLKVSLLENIGEISSMIKNVLQAIKNYKHK